MSKCAAARYWGLLALVIVALFAFTATIAHAQSAASATVVGRVLDPKGNTVPDAVIVARNVETGIERDTKSTSDGLYRFSNLPPGIYDISAAVSGFTKALAKGVKLQVGEQRDVNFNLEISGVTEQVKVTSELPLVETTKTDTSAVIDDKTVAVLPTTTAFGGVNGVSNDYASLATIAPGVKYDFSGNSSDLLGPGAINDRGLLINVDGGNIIDQLVSTRDALGASLEEVKEFQVITNNYNAEYGQAGSLIINVITKSGTNSLHGDGHAYFRGRNLTANTWFFNQTSEAQTRRAPFHKHEGGFVVGGPFIKDRTFWLVSYEQTRQAQPLTLTFPGNPITVAQPSNELLWSAKVDHKFTKNHLFTARFNVQRELQDNLLVQITQKTVPESLVSSTVHDNILNLGLTSTLTAHTVNELRFLWHRFLSQTPDKTTVPGQAGPNFYRGAAFCCPQGGLQNRYQYIDNFSWTRGTHTVKTGFNISHFPYFSLFQQFHFGRYEGFSGGLPTKFTTGFGPGTVTSADNIYGAYVQDSWKIKPNLTLNYGLRYDLEDGAFKGGTISDATRPGSGCFQGNGIIPACSKDHNNFQPRVGIAWSPSFQSGLMHMLFGDPGKSVIRASFAEVTQLAFLNIVLDSLNFDGVTLLTRTIKSSTVGTDGTTKGSAVLASFPNSPSPLLLALFRPVNFFGRVRPIAPDLHNAETRHASLTISRQFGPSLVVETGYIGVFGFGLYGERDRNFPAILADPAHPGFFFLGPRADQRFTAVRTNENTRTSAYHGFTLTATKRLSHHFQFQAGYVLSKQLASTEDFYGLSEPGDPRNIGAERALSYNDVRHQGNFGVVVDTERLFGAPFIRHIFNDWTIGFIGQLQSGRPYPISTGDAPFASSFFPGLGSETQQRPNILSDGTLISTNIASTSGTNLAISQAGVAQCLSFFSAAQCPLQTTFLAPATADPNGPIDSFTGDVVDFQFLNGNVARNLAKGDPYYRFDLSLIKAIRIPKHEQMRVELKAEFFNLFNRPNFLLYNGNNSLSALSIPTPGMTLPDGTVVKNPAFANARTCTTCLNPFTGFYAGANGQPLKLQNLQQGRVDSDIQNPNWANIGDPTTTDIARTIQLSVRFRW